VLDSFDKILEDTERELKEKTDAESLLKNGLRALARIERFRFLLDNLLESVKRDQSLHNSVLLFKTAGLFDSPNVSIDPSEETRNSPWRSNQGSGAFLRKILNRVKQVALTLMELVTNAIKVIPRLVSLKPKPSIGLSGPFPTFSLEFELEAESITIHELFEVLSGSTEV
jgi:hypothetical protein